MTCQIPRVVQSDQRIPRSYILAILVRDSNWHDFLLPMLIVFYLGLLNRVAAHQINSINILMEELVLV